MQNTVQEVELLFESKSIVELREVETRTRHDIEEKKKQLRQVVGNSYRDLISSADTIIDISNSCNNAVHLIGEVQSGLENLSSSIRQRRNSSEKEQANSSYDKLYALGSRVKYLIDTPETIWGYLDSKDFIEASRRFVRSAEVHASLGHSKHLLRRFPLLQHQWPLVKKFRSQIWDRAFEWLGSQGELTSEQLASTLLALALLKPMNGGELLKTYLSARQRYIVQCLEAPATAGQEAADLESLTFILGDVLVLVGCVVAQCGELFLQLPGITSTPLLIQVLEQEDLGLSDLSFDPHPHAKSEIEAWQATQSAVRERLQSLQPATLASQCSAWLDELSLQFKEMGGKLLGSCGSGKDLLTVESGVKAALEAWQYELPADRVAADGAQSDLLEGLQGVPLMHCLNWKDASQWVLDRPLGLWPLLLEHSLLDRAQALVAQNFTSVVDAVSALLGSALKESEALPPFLPGEYPGGSWSAMVVLQPGTPPASDGAAGKRRLRRLARARGQGSRGDQGGESGSAGGMKGAGSQGWLQHTAEALQVFDDQLSRALAAALDACYGQHAGAPPTGADRQAAQGRASAAKNASAGEYAAARAAILEPFVQERCLEAAQAIAARLQKELDSLADPPAVDAAAAVVGALSTYASTAEKSLVIGRLALAIATRSSALPVILGPPEQWQQQQQATTKRAGVVGGGPGVGMWGATAAVASPTPAAHSPKLERVQQDFRSAGLRGYQYWAGWASHSLSAQLAAKLAADSALVADAPFRGWEEVVVVPEGELAAEELELEGDLRHAPGEMRFWLPAAPSNAAMEAALGACQEADHAGGHLIDDESLAMLKWQLAGALLDGLAADLAPGGRLSQMGLSEKGVLQLLFDLRFLYQLLAGAGPVGIKPEENSPAALKAAAASRKKQLKQVEEQLQSMLDPIDWATYESYLYANIDKFNVRCQVLFGIILRSSQGLAQKKGGSSAPTLAPTTSSTNSNVLRLCTGGPRFPYLPVNTAAMLRQASIPHVGSGQRLGSAPSLQSSSVSDKFSFAAGFSLWGDTPGLGSGAQGGGAAPSQGGLPGPAAAVAAAAGPTMGTSALDALRHSRFGSLLGDKAAEVSAMASGVTQSLGEYNFSNTLTGALGGGAGGLLSSFNLPGAFKGERGRR